MDYYYSVAEETENEIKIKRSRFIAHLIYCETMAGAKEYIQHISKIHKTANHNCWAYVVGDNAENEHCSDAGEPAGTAGKPMLNALKKHNMTNVVAVVTRYFGGVKLGIRGLIDAYGQAVDEAVAATELKKLVNMTEYSLVTTYDFAEILKYKLHELGAEIIDVQYTDKVAMTVEIEEKDNDNLQKLLEELSGSGKIKKM